MMKFIKYSLAILLLIFIFMAAFIAHTAWRHNMLSSPVYDTVAPAIPDFISDDADTKPNVLLFSKTNSYRHLGAIPAAKQMFTNFAKTENWNLFETENAAVHGKTILDRFDLIIWNNVTGDVLTQEQRTAFKTYIEEGGQFLAIHGTGGNPEYDWQWFPKTLIKAQFTAHPMNPQFQDGTLIVENTEHPTTEHLPKEWGRKDEWYSFETSPRADVNVLISLDENSYNPSRWGDKRELGMGGDHPMVWHHNVGDGRVYFSALGHTAESYEDQNFRKFMKRSCLWLLQ